MTIQRVIQESMAAGAWENGLFLAERLHAVEKSEASALLVARCLQGRGQTQAALLLLQEGPCVAPDNRYLRALCCVELGRPREAEQALVRDPQASEWRREVPGGAYGLALLGGVYRALQQPERAAECYRAALALEPLLWTAAEGRRWTPRRPSRCRSRWRCCSRAHPAVPLARRPLPRRWPVRAALRWTRRSRREGEGEEEAVPRRQASGGRRLRRWDGRGGCAGSTGRGRRWQRWRPRRRRSAAAPGAGPSAAGRWPS